MLNIENRLSRLIARYLILYTAITPAMIGVARAEEVGKFEANLSDKSADVKDIMKSTNFNISGSAGGMTVDIGGYTSTISQDDPALKEAEEKFGNKDMLEKAKEYGSQNSLTGAVAEGNALSAEYASDTETDENKKSVNKFFHDISAKYALDGTISFKNDPSMLNLSNQLDPSNPNSPLYTFTDACQDGYEYTTANQTQFIGERKTCLKYKDNPNSCNIKHSYNLTVAQEYSPEYIIGINKCECREGDDSCNANSLMGCVAVQVGFDGEGYLKTTGGATSVVVKNHTGYISISNISDFKSAHPYATCNGPIGNSSPPSFYCTWEETFKVYDTSWTGWRRTGKVVLNKVDSIKRIVLDKANYSDAIAVYVYKEGSKPNYRVPNWSSHGILPMRNYMYNKNAKSEKDKNPSIDNLCSLKSQNVHCEAPAIKQRTFVCGNGGYYNGSCGGYRYPRENISNCSGPICDVISTAPLYDFITEQKIEDKDINLTPYQPVIDVTDWFKGEEGEVYNIEIITSTKDSGQGALSFRIEYDASSAVEETWTPQSCVNMANNIDFNSTEYSRAKVSCAENPDENDIAIFSQNREDYCIYLSNNHTVCNTDINSPLKKVKGYNPETDKYEDVEINGLCKRVVVNLDNHLSNSEDYLNNSCSELLNKQNEEGNSCHQIKVECKQTTKDSPERLTGDENESEQAEMVQGGDCYLRQYTYECGKQVEIPTTTVTKKIACSDYIKNCEDGSCVNFDQDISMTQDLSKASAVLQAAQFMVADIHCDGEDEQSQECQVFKGDKQTCHIFDTKATYQNCCKDITGANVTSYISSLLSMTRLMSSDQALGGFLNKLDHSGMTTKITDKSLSVTEATHAKVLSYADNITGVEGMGAFTENVAVTVMYMIYREAIKKAIQELAMKIGQSVGNALASGIASGAAGTGGLIGGGNAGASKVFTDAAQKAVEKALEEAGKQAAQTGGQAAAQGIASSLATCVCIIGIVYAIYTLVDTALKMIFKCDKEDITTASAKALKKCTESGNRCLRKLPFFGCIDRQYIYCCYSTPLSRIIMEQIAKTKQLGLTFPNKACSGIPIDKLNEIDWDLIDLSEWTALVLQAGDYELTDAQNAIANSTDLKEKLNVGTGNSSYAEDKEVDTSLSLGDDFDQKVAYYSSRYYDDQIMAEYQALPQETKNAIAYREKIYEYTDYFADRDSNEDKQAEFEALSEEIQTEILNREALIAQQMAERNLSSEEQNKVNDNIRDGKSLTEEIDLSNVNVKGESENQKIAGVQLGVGTADLCGFTAEQVAVVILDYRLRVDGLSYDAVKTAYESNNLSGDVVTYLNNLRNTLCTTNGGHYYITGKSLTVDHVTGKDSALDINSSNTNLVNDKDYCSGDNPECARKSSTERLEKAFNNVKIYSDYDTMEDIARQVEEEYYYDVDRGGINVSSEKK